MHGTLSNFNSLPGHLLPVVEAAVRALQERAVALEEEYQHTLEEETLLQALEDQPLCPGCERRVHEDWQVCPNCQTLLRKPCQHCGRLLELPWNICPYCGTAAPGARKESVNLDDALRDLRLADESNEDPLKLS